MTRTDRTCPDGQDPISPQRLRHAMGGFPTGVAVVAAELDGSLVGLAANSLVSVSLDPPLVSLSFARSSTTWPALRQAGRWGISLLGDEDVDLLTAMRRPASERFRDIPMDRSGGVPDVLGCLAVLTVEPVAEIDAGDHVLTLLHVRDLARDDEQLPLVFFGGGVHRLQDPPVHDR
ncbi:flavin reductase family protein [Brachybacterium phenoliresistens]|nr:flavin reductase family protein [Brachybacterium phenoliresistens]